RKEVLHWFTVGTSTDRDKAIEASLRYKKLHSCRRLDLTGVFLTRDTVDSDIKFSRVSEVPRCFVFGDKIFQRLAGRIFKHINAVFNAIHVSSQMSPSSFFLNLGTKTLTGFHLRHGG